MPPARSSSMPWVGVALGLVVLFATADAATDWYDGASLFHLWGEAAVVVLACTACVSLGVRALADRRRLHEEVDRLRGTQAAWREDARRWEARARSAVRAFGDAVDSEFDRWSLTASERAVALLLLKGLSMKDIAAVRGTSERAVRQQATSVYGKAAVEGRAELASYFLDALSPEALVGDSGSAVSPPPNPGDRPSSSA